MTTARFSQHSPRIFAFYSLMAIVAFLAACGNGGSESGQGGGPPGGAPPPMPVEIVTLAAKPVE